jgi:hypothetical protein
MVAPADELQSLVVGRILQIFYFQFSIFNSITRRLSGGDLVMLAMAIENS